MDVQFVLDVYACAMYIASYLSKAHKGISASTFAKGMWWSQKR